MIVKEERSRILSLFSKKDEKIFAAALIDNINHFESNNYITNTDFLNMNEKRIAESILNKFNINYKTVSVFCDSERFVIFMIPDYISDDALEDIFNEYISVLKITPKSKVNISHSKYMGTIYSLGLKESVIGDIIVNNEVCYVSVLKSAESYFCNNLFSVARNEVKAEPLKVNDDTLKNVRVKFEQKEILVASLRIDVVLAAAYNLSRSEVKLKIENGDLIINSKEMFFVAYAVQESDIVSFRRCGKFKVCKAHGNTKSGKTYLTIKKYV